MVKFHISYISHHNFSSKQKGKHFSIISFVFVLLCRSESATELNCKTCGFDVIQELSEVWKVRRETRSCSRRRLTFTCVYFCPLCSLSSSTRILESEYQFRRNKINTLPFSEMFFGIMGVWPSNHSTPQMYCEKNTFPRGAQHRLKLKMIFSWI